MTISAQSLRTARSLTEAFYRVCRRHPERTAIRDRGREMTYQDLANRVRDLTAGLTASLGTDTRGHRSRTETDVEPTARGAPNSVIAVAAEPSADTVCALLAALTIGGAYLPLDPAAPADHLTEVLDLAQPCAALGCAQQADLHRRQPWDIDQVAADGRTAQAGRTNGTLRGIATGAEDPAYVMFTSGSTGHPKGVVISHRALLYSTAARLDAYGVPDRVPLLHAATVDVYQGVVFWALLTGGTLVIGPQGLADIAATAALINEEEITDLVYLSSLYPLLLEHADHQRMLSLRRVMIGSDRWSEAVIDRHIALLPDVDLHNEYGPTEAAVWTSQACVWKARTAERRPLTIGRPVAGTGYRLLDPAGLPRESDRKDTPDAPHQSEADRTDSSRGELCITGAQLALGYLRVHELTAERFVTFADGTRAFRTGDLAEITASGEVLLGGRIDRQLKVQGHRIEPLQVETALMRHPAVGLAHIMARTDLGPGAVLVAYVTPGRDDMLIVTDDVRDTIAKVLPPFMIPTGWVVLDTLPRLTSGKIDEAALSAPAGVQNARQRHHREPHSRIEAEVAAIVEDVVGRVLESPTQSLFDAGVSSLALMQIVSRLGRDYGVSVPISALAATPSIQMIAAEVQAARPADRPALRPAAHDAAGTPLSAQQQQVWYLTHLAPAARAYNTQCSLYLDGPLDVDALVEALSFVVTRHEILRTTVHDDGVEPVQVVHDPWQVEVAVRDLTAVPDTERHAVLEREIAKQTAVVFDTSVLPLVRWRLYRTGTRSWVLSQVEHHFVHDGWSAVLLLREIRDAYAAAATGQTPRMPDLPVQYRDWVAWQKAWLRSQDAARQRRYWSQQLHGVAPHGPTFTPDFPRPARQGFRGARVSTIIPESTVDTIDLLCARHGTSRFAVFLSAFAMLVRQHTSADDIVLGSALANRTHPDVEPLLGMFVNALPLRLAVRQGDTIGQVVTRAMQVLLAAQDHQDFPLIELIKELGLPREPSLNPLFGLMFAFHDAPRPRFEAAGVTGRLHIDHNDSAKNDVNVVCVPRPAAPGSSRSHAGITVLWEYDRDLYEPATAENLMAAYARILQSLTRPAAWDQSATTLTVLDSDQANQILRAGTGPVAVAAHSRLEAGVDATIRSSPQHTAIQHGDRALTYQQLDAAAAALQTHLTALAVGPGDRVVVACGPGPEHAAAVVAVLRQGAAFVCLDPNEPAARLGTIVAAARPAAVVCSEATAMTISAVISGIPVVSAATGDTPRLIRGRSLNSTAPHPLVDHAPADDPSQRSAQDAAYLVYTSGATGTPKAVVATHTNAVTALTARTARTRPGPVRTLITLPLQFDVATSMIMWTLWTGGTVVFPGPSHDSRDPMVVRELIERHEVTHLNVVSSFYRQFLRTVPTGWDSPLRTVAVGGEPCPAPLLRDHTERLPTVVLDNEYGPTETTVWCTAARVHDPANPTDATARGNTRVTIGAPVANYRVHVLDERHHLLPVGARGELCVAGPGVTAGYLNQPELTAERFVTPVDGPLAGIRLYRTGDQARLTTSGEIELVGRLDEQVKIRGYRVELGDVRDQLRAHPAVADACVVVDPASERDGRDARLIAYLAVPEQTSVLPERIRAWAQQRLPGYMVPAVISILDALPLTTTGKIDRRALPHSTDPAAITAASRSGPGHTGLRLAAHEQAVIHVWEEVLGRSDIGLDDDWFALGGDSLSAIRASRLLHERGMPISVAALLQASTPREVAARLPLSVNDDQPAAGQSPVERRPGGTQIVLTAMHAWFFAQNFADPAHFTQARLFAVPADTTVAQLRIHLDAVLDRHEAFRTVFRPSPDGWAGYLLDELPGADMPAYPVAPDLECPAAAALDHLHHGLDITRGPLWRAAVFTDQERDRRWVYLVAHHLIVDAVSWEVLAHELNLAVTDPDVLAPTAPALTANPPQPSAEEASYWESFAAQDMPVLASPTAALAPYGELVHVDVEFSTRVTRDLVDLAHRGNVAILDILLAALHQALAPATRGDGLYAFLEGHGRDHLENAGQIVGWLTSLYPVLLTDRTPNAPTPAPHLLATAERFHRQRAAVPRGGTGFGDTRYLEPDSRLGELLATMPMPELTINYLGRREPHDQPVRVLASPTGQAISPANVLPTALHITAVIDDGALRIHLTSDPGRIDRPALTVITTRLRATVQHVAHVQPLTRSPDAQARRLFVLHSVDGEVHWYTRLAAALGPRWDCHGLRATLDCTDDDLAALAAHYVEHLRRVQPRGPYNVLGWSFGGVLAYAIAQQLEAAGDAVERLVLLDPPPISVLTHGVITSDPLTEHLTALLPDMDTHLVRAAALDAAAAPANRRSDVLIDRLTLDTDPHRTDPRIADTVRLLIRHHDFLSRWIPTGTVRGMSVVHPATVHARATARQWSLLARNVLDADVPGDHHTMLRDPTAVATMATLLALTPPAREPDGEGTA